MFANEREIHFTDEEEVESGSWNSPEWTDRADLRWNLTPTCGVHRR